VLVARGRAPCEMADPRVAGSLDIRVALADLQGILRRHDVEAPASTVALGVGRLESQRLAGRGVDEGDGDRAARRRREVVPEDDGRRGDVDPFDLAEAARADRGELRR